MKKLLVTMAGATVAGVVTGLVVRKIMKKAETVSEANWKEEEKKFEEEVADIKQWMDEQNKEDKEEQEMRMVFLNDSKKDIVRFMEELANGEFDDMMDSVAFGTLMADKDRLVEKTQKGLSIEEAFNEMFVENVEALKELVGDELTVSELVEMYNNQVSMDDETINGIIEAVTLTMSERETEVFKRSMEMVKNIRMEVA